MPIGSITPGNFVTITADTITSLPTSYTFTPSPTMGVLSANVQALTLQMVSNDKYLDTAIASLKTYTDANIAAGDATVKGMLHRTLEGITELSTVSTGGGALESILADSASGGTSGARSTIAYVDLVSVKVGDIVRAELAIDADATGADVIVRTQWIAKNGVDPDVYSYMTGHALVPSGGSRARIVVVSQATIPIGIPDGSALRVVMIVQKTGVTLGTLRNYGTGAIRASVKHVGL